MRIKQTAVLVSFILCCLICSIRSIGVAKDANFDNKIVWGTAESGCRIGVDTTTVAVVAGEPADIKVVVSNSAQNPLTYVHSSAPLDDFIIDGVDSRGDKVNRLAFALMDGAGLTTLGSINNGQEVCQTIRLNRVLDLSVAGEHKISIQFCAGNGEKHLILRAPIITVKVVEQGDETFKSCD